MHMYVSENIIGKKLKNRMQETVRKNREKHDMYKNIKNVKVKEKNTHCWW